MMLDKEDLRLLEELLDRKLAEQEKRINANTRSCIRESENLILRELERRIDKVEGDLSKLERKVDDQQQYYYSIVKLTNENTELLLKTVDLNMRVKKLEEKTA